MNKNGIYTKKNEYHAELPGSCLSAFLLKYILYEKVGKKVS
jgi:hypothetical protein